MVLGEKDNILYEKSLHMTDFGMPEWEFGTLAGRENLYIFVALCPFKYAKQQPI